MAKLTKTVEDWQKDFGTLDATNWSPEFAIANHILANLNGYRKNAKFRFADEVSLSKALIAYAKLLHEHGVTP